MKITYKIEQIDVDDILVSITSPKELKEAGTRIRVPHFVWAELEDNIKTNLTRNIKRYCAKNKRYAEFISNEIFEFEPDTEDVSRDDTGACWFYTQKFVGYPYPYRSPLPAEEERFENEYRYNNVCPLPQRCTTRLLAHRDINNPDKPIVFKRRYQHRKYLTLRNLSISFDIKESEVRYWIYLQQHWAPDKGNKAGKVYFPRHIKTNNRIYFTITEINKYIQLLHKHNPTKYDSIINGFNRYMANNPIKKHS